MALKDLVIPSEVVKIPNGADGEFVDQPVRGLTSTDIVFLLQEQRGALEMFYAKAAAGELATDDYASLASEIVASAPALLGSIIACGCGEPDKVAAEVATRLPFTVQLDAFEKIARLTFAAEGGAKKVLETVITLMSGMTALQDSQALSLSGRGASGNR